MRSAKPWDLLDKNKWTNEDIRNKRLDICEGCEFFNKLRQCTKCNCFMDAKTWIKDAYCPIYKW